MPEWSEFTHGMARDCVSNAERLDTYLVTTQRRFAERVSLIIEALARLRHGLPLLPPNPPDLSVRAMRTRGLQPFRSHGRSFTSAHEAAVDLAGTIFAAADGAIDGVYTVLGEMTQEDVVAHYRERFEQAGIARSRRSWSAFRGRYLRARPRVLDFSEVEAALRMEQGALRAREDRQAPVRRRPACRVRIVGRRILLDGEPVPLDLADESRGAVLCLLRHLLAAGGDWRSSSELDVMEDEAPCKEHVGTRWDLTRKKLPPCLLDLTETNRRKGLRLTAAAWRR